MFRYGFPILLLILLLLSAQPVNAEWYADRVPDEYAEGVERAIDNAGENADTIIKILDQTPDEMMEGASFLIASMPVVDLAAMDFQTFMDNLTLAYKAREVFPYASEISMSDFYHYVLPYRVSQEPIENWRPFFYEKALELCSDAQTIEEAAIAVNTWAASVIGFKQTQRRDQGPFETLISGYGRCEEMMIFYIDASRAAGIPARQAWTPYWAHCDNNHAWTEIMTEDRKWNFIGSAEKAKTLNEAWFSGTAKRAALVMSMPFGIPDNEAGVEVCRIVEGDNPYAQINSTPNYHVTGKMVIEVVNENDSPLVDANVVIALWNFGVLRPIAKLKTDESGKVEISIGAGDYLVTSGTEELGAAMIVTATNEHTVVCELKAGEINIPESFWLRFPLPE